MKITYQVNDGYAGAARPQNVEVDDYELVHDCDTDEERQELIDDAVQEHFEQNVTWQITEQSEFPTEAE